MPLGRSGRTETAGDRAGFLTRHRAKQALTAYDAAYVALAEALDAPLVTLDARLARAGGHGAKIELG